MRANNFFMKSETITVAGKSEIFSITGSNSGISPAEQIFQAATPAGTTTNYGNYNIFVSGVIKADGAVTGTFSRSALIPEFVSDSVDSFQIIAR